MAGNTSNGDRSNEERLATTETHIDTIYFEIRGVKEQIDDLASQIQRGFANINERSHTDWPKIFGVITIMLIVIGFIGSGYVRDINRLEESNQGLQKTLTQERVENARHGEQIRALERETFNVDRGPTKH